MRGRTKPGRVERTGGASARPRWGEGTDDDGNDVGDGIGGSGVGDCARKGGATRREGRDNASAEAVEVVAVMTTRRASRTAD